MSDTYDEAHRKYEQSEKGKERQRAYMKRRREDPAFQQKEKERQAKRDRTEYMREYQREYARKRRAEKKAQRDS